jgi:hypothetical protein
MNDFPDDLRCRLPRIGEHVIQFPTTTGNCLRLFPAGPRGAWSISAPSSDPDNAGGFVAEPDARTGRELDHARLISLAKYWRDHWHNLKGCID